MNPTPSAERASEQFSWSTFRLGKEPHELTGDGSGQLSQNGLEQGLLVVGKLAQSVELLGTVGL